MERSSDWLLAKGFSLGCLEGSIMDNTTAYAFRSFKLGVAHNTKEEDAQGNRHRSQQPAEP